MAIPTSLVSGAVGAATMFLLLTGLQSGSPKVVAEESVRTRKLELVDQTGKVRGRLSLVDGNPTLSMIDDAGVNRVVIVHDAEQSGVFVSDPKGQTRAGMAHFAHGGTGFALHGPEGKGAAVLYYKKSGSMTFYGADGKVALKLPKD